MSKYDWSNVPDRARYIFTDQVGDVFESDFEPILDDDGWIGIEISTWWLSKCDPFRGNWCESLEDRPK